MRLGRKRTLLLILILVAACGVGWYLYKTSPTGRVNSLLNDLRPRGSTGWFAELRHKYGFKDSVPDANVIRKELVRLGPPAVPALIDALKHGDARSSVAARALGEIADQRAIQALVQYLKDDKSQTLDGPGQVELDVSQCSSPAMVAEMIRLLPNNDKAGTVLLWMQRDIDPELYEAMKTASPQLRKRLDQVIRDRHYQGPGWGYPRWPSTSTNASSD